MPIQILQGQVQPFDPPSLPWDDPAIQHGWAGFFETMRCESGQIKRLDGHLQRLRRSLNAWNLRFPCEESILYDAFQREIELHAKTAPLRIKIIAGDDPNLPPESSESRPTRAWIAATPLEGDNAKPLNQRSSQRLKIFRDFRISTTHPLTGFKSTQYALYREARRRANAEGWDEAVLLNERGEVAEACHFNLFWINGSAIYTPARETGCLPGVMAAQVTEAARDLGLSVQRGIEPPETLLNAESVFITNSVAELIGVHEIQGRTFTLPGDHPTGARLFQAISKLCEPRSAK